MCRIGISPEWVGFNVKTGFSTEIVYIARRIWIAYNEMIDMEEKYKYDKEYLEMIGYHTNPEWYKQRTEAEKNKHVNLSYKGIIEKLQREQEAMDRAKKKLIPTL